MAGRSAERFSEQRLKALIHAEEHPAKVPGVLFLCVHNAGRSQMALGWFSHLAGSRAVAWSGGSEPGAEINQVVVAAMAEVGIDISRSSPSPGRTSSSAPPMSSSRWGAATPARSCPGSTTRIGSSRIQPASHSRRSGRFATRSVTGSTHSSSSSSRRPAMMVGNEECRNQSDASIRLAASADDLSGGHRHRERNLRERTTGLGGVGLQPLRRSQVRRR